MKVNSQFFLVLIDKEEQRKLKNLTAGLVAADTYTDMNYYLQHGPVLQIGDKAKSFFPEVQLGDNLVFHHHVEDDDWRDVTEYMPETFSELTKNYNYEFRLVEATFDDVFGVIKPDGTIIAAKGHLWCKELKEKKKSYEDAWIKSGLLWVSDGGYIETEDDMRNKIEQLDLQVKFMCEGVQVDEIAVAEMKKEQAELTRKLNKKKMHRHELQFINAETARDFQLIEPGDHIFVEGWTDYKGYPLKLRGEEYIIVRENYVAMGLRKKYFDDAETTAKLRELILL